MPGANKWSRNRERTHTKRRASAATTANRNNIIERRNPFYFVSPRDVCAVFVLALICRSTHWKWEIENNFWNLFSLIGGHRFMKFNERTDTANCANSTAKVQFHCTGSPDDGWDSRRSIGGHLRWRTVPSFRWLHNCTWNKSRKDVATSPCLFTNDTEIWLKWVFRASVNKLIYEFIVSSNRRCIYNN